ncbi:thioredoxin-disulfide reductase [Candidatus Uhrbacteria bacterium]|nr:thioredoxin-disulfide reductase [Candidatus Uhrbacteria bacterium]
MSDIHNLIIIGSGPAGLTAAVYAARANLAPVLFAGQTWGGQLMLTSDVENYPGFPKGVQGPELMQMMRDQAARFGTTIIDDNVTRVDFSNSPHKVFVGEKQYSAKAIIIATGASSIWLGLDSETRLRGKGVSSCATCDGAFFRNKEVVVVGGGDSALEEANFLTKFCTKVTIVHRRDALRGSKIMQDRAKANSKIAFIWDSAVEEILGDTHVTGVKLKNVKTNAVTEYKTDGVFVAIGHTPNTGIFKGQIELDAKGYIVPRENSGTNVAGVFVSGDVNDHRYRQAVTAAGMGCMAAIDVEKWLEENEDELLDHLAQRRDTKKARFVPHHKAWG